MCMIVFDNRRDNTVDPEPLTKASFERCFEKHPDGLGIMYPENGKLVTWRHVDDLEGLYARYLVARSHKAPVAMHFRRATKGSVMTENCHPFEILPGEFAFMHNGTITPLTSLIFANEKLKASNISDTRLLNDEIFARMEPDFLKSPACVAMIEKLIQGDRLLFMDNTGGHTILNASTGYWDGQIWYANEGDKNYIRYGTQYTSPLPKQQTGTNSDDAPKCGIEPPKPFIVPAIGNKTIVLFDYGLFSRKDLNKLNARYVAEGYVKGFNLYATDETGQGWEPHIQPSSSDGAKLEGQLYTIRTKSPQEVITKLDLWMRGFYRAIRPVYHQSDSLKTEAVLYAGYVTKIKNPVIIVPFGNWKTFLDKPVGVRVEAASLVGIQPRQLAKPTVVIHNPPVVPQGPLFQQAKSTQITIPGIRIKCDECNSFKTQIHEFTLKGRECRVLYCTACEKESDLQPKPTVENKPVHDSEDHSIVKGMN